MKTPTTTSTFIPVAPQGIILSGPSNSGKTNSIKRFINAYLSTDPNYRILYPTPLPTVTIPAFFIAERISDKKIIVVLLHGDSKKDIEKHFHNIDTELKTLGYPNYDIVIGTSRTRRDTVTFYNTHITNIYWLSKVKSSHTLTPTFIHIYDGMALAIKSILDKL